MSIKAGNQNVVLGGRGPLVLRPSDHIATGGEGSVYRAKNTVVKIFTDPKKMERDDMSGKIKLLSQIRHPYIVAPTGLVFNKNKKPIGYYMPYVDGEPLSRVFTNDFRARTSFTDKDASKLVERMREVVEVAHKETAILVDANELNWLMKYSKADGALPRAIDVDSWQIGSWPARVIMPSIRDWHTQGFSEETDWFAWAVVTFQLYTGIHPYKGKLDGFKMGDLEGRMKENKSIFTKGVKLNRAVRDPSLIPTGLYDWYHEVFESRVRTEPPSPFAKAGTRRTAGHIARIAVTSKGSLIYDKLSKEKVVRIYSCGVALLQNGSLIEVRSKNVIHVCSEQNVEVIRVDSGYLIACGDGADVTFLYKADKEKGAVELGVPVDVFSVLRYQERLFVGTHTGLTEIKIIDLGKPVIALGKTWQTMRNSTTLYSGVGVQDALGATYVIAPFDDKSVAMVRTPELDDVRVVNAKGGERFVVVVALDPTGKYKKFEFSFDDTYTSYTLWTGDADSSEINTAILPKGVCATIVQDGEIVIYVPRNGKVSKVSDKHVGTDMALEHMEGRVVYIRNNELWSMKMT